MTDLELQITSEPRFSGAYPDDFAVRISDVRATPDPESGTDLIRNYSGSNFDLNDFRTVASPGDKLRIEVNGVQRQNYRDEVFEIYNYFPKSFYVPIE